ncbi:hypothetical protein CSW98_01390 [Vibrio sp. HA2012]|uniref:hypothetical protein n=1 Tax=Vibrio sp. HA2012 TaxID=1971595 RepID=UPI000C2C1499|nr:hypothetical protein [Vibrio sp. HA2012]PJC87808.1 hypothetical protein CSW98_01390 [Vibrio sp. HA2012]
MKPDPFKNLFQDEIELGSEFVELVIDETAKRRGLRHDQVRASLLAKLNKIDREQQILTEGLSGAYIHATPMGVY